MEHLLNELPSASKNIIAQYGRLVTNTK